MRIVTHEFSDTLERFDEIPSFRFENHRFERKMETSNRMTMVGSVINRIYVDSLEFPPSINKEHQCLFIVSIPYYNIFRRMYQERFGAIPTSFDELTYDQIIRWIMNTYDIKIRKAKQLLYYFSGGLLKMLYNPDAVNTFLTGEATESKFHSYTYDTVYRYLMGDTTVSNDDYIRALAKYKRSRTAITKWLQKRLEKEEPTLNVMRLLLWLQGKGDADLLLFAREVT